MTRNYDPPTTVSVTVYAVYKITHGFKALATFHDQYVNSRWSFISNKNLKKQVLHYTKENI
jgi:hypothetical protein